MAEDRKTAVEQSLELLWSTRERTGPGPRPALSVARIVRAAIDIADTEGLDALSMQRLAGAFGYTTMSLYRYVPGKAQLIDAMADVACGLPPDMSEVTGGWRAEAELWADELWKVYRRHEWLVRVQIKNPPIGPNQLAWFESLMATLARAGLDWEDMIGLAMFLSAAVRDLARFSTGLRPMGLGYAQVLGNILDSDRFPTLKQLIADSPEGLADGAEDTGEQAVKPVVDFGVRLLLDGVAAQVRNTGRRPEAGSG